LAKGCEHDLQISLVDPDFDRIAVGFARLFGQVLNQRLDRISHGLTRGLRAGESGLQVSYGFGVAVPRLLGGEAGGLGQHVQRITQACGSGGLFVGHGVVPVALAIAAYTGRG
jgi:hypothetical protein